MKKFIGTIVLFVLISTSAWAQGDWQTIKNPIQVFEKGYIQVVGVCEEGQSRYRALRAAQVIAQRDLLEILQGLNLYGQTTVKDGMLQSDEISTSVHGFLRGAVKCGETYHSDKGYAEVCMRLNIRGKGGLYDIILPLMKEKKIWPEQRPAYEPKLIPKVIGTPSTPTPEEKKVAETRPLVRPPSELKEANDGLIVDTREFQFRPALVNRILTKKNEIIFDPSKVVSNILVERGCGGFTTDISKARALLKTWGSSNPMTVKSTGVIKLTDVQISADDASAIFVHDQKSNLLAEAKVVFVLK